MIRIFIGKSASGKDTFLKKQVAARIEPIVSYTTRPMRPREVNGVDYHFVSRQEYEEMLNRGEILESRSYDTLVNGEPDRWFYGSPCVDPKQDYAVILDVQGAESYIEAYGGENIEIVYVHAEDDIRRERAKLRPGFDAIEWNRRAKDDEEKFSLEALVTLSAKLGKDITVLINNADKPTSGRIGGEDDRVHC